MRQNILFFLLILSFLATALDYEANQLTIPTDYSRNISHYVTTSGTLSIEIPVGFNVASTTAGAIINTTHITYTSSNLTKFQYILNSPSSCTENQLYTSNIYINTIKSGEFVYLCLPDNKVVDYKVEYGHGDGCYLSEPWIPKDQVTLFNLVRFYPLGHLFVPNENMKNVSIDCFYEKLPIRTYGRVEVRRDDVTNLINGTFSWKEIIGGYWFRLGVLSQDLMNKNIEETYNVSCNNFHAEYSHQEINVPFQNYSLKIVDDQPFAFEVFNDTNPSNMIVKIKNKERYIARDILTVFSINNNTVDVEIGNLDPGENKYFRLEKTSELNISMFFIPPWFYDCLNIKKIRQDQTLFPQNNPPKIINGIPDPDPIPGPGPACYYYVQEGHVINFTIWKTDEDLDDLTTRWIVNSTLAQQTFDPYTYENDTFLFNTTGFGNQSINITVYVDDYKSGNDSYQCLFDINETLYRPPVIVNAVPDPDPTPGPGPMCNITIVEGQEGNFTIWKTDPDQDELWTMWYMNGILSQVTNDSWQYSNDTLLFSTIGLGGTILNVTAWVDDNIIGNDSTSCYWNVIPNEPPNITGGVPDPDPTPGPGLYCNVTIQEGNLLNFTIGKTDKEKDNLTTRWIRDGVLIHTSYDSWVYSNETLLLSTWGFANQTINITVYVDDFISGNDSYQCLFNINETPPPPPNQKPNITAAYPSLNCSFTIQEGKPINITITKYDKDNDTLYTFWYRNGTQIQSSVDPYPYQKDSLIYSIGAVGNTSYNFTAYVDDYVTGNDSTQCIVKVLDRPDYPAQTAPERVSVGGHGGSRKYANRRPSSSTPQSRMTPKKGISIGGLVSGTETTTGIETETCKSDWICSNWGSCLLSGYEFRTCVDYNNCGILSTKPTESRPCLPEGTELLEIKFEPSCDDGIKNQEELGVDCGGPCIECAAFINMSQVPGPCGDAVCNLNEWETCPADCVVEGMGPSAGAIAGLSSGGGVYWLVILWLGVLGIGLRFAYKKIKKDSKF